jgi:hypothetical protein
LSKEIRGIRSTQLYQQSDVYIYEAPSNSFDTAAPSVNEFQNALDNEFD